MKDPLEAAAADDVVTALHYADVGLAGDLAAWCGGAVEASEDGAAPVIRVPTSRGPRPARLGDWIIRRAAGDYSTCDATTFVALHTPLT